MLVANFSFSQKMLTSEKGKQTSFSFSIEKSMLGCLDDKYFLNLSACSGKENSANMSSTCLLKTDLKLDNLKAINFHLVLDNDCCISQNIGRT